MAATRETFEKACMDNVRMTVSGPKGWVLRRETTCTIIIWKLGSGEKRDIAPRGFGDMNSSTL
jgi:hypothetical protein